MAPEPDEDDWEVIMDARANALADALGGCVDGGYHAPHPLCLGGQADILVFKHHLDGVVYVTADLTGRPGESYTDYELMICHRSESEWGPDILSRLAPYALHVYIGSGESMDIGPSVPAGSRIDAFLFDTYASFKLFEGDNELRLCIGITKDELDFKLQHGPEALLELLRQNGVYPFTDLERQSMPLPG